MPGSPTACPSPVELRMERIAVDGALITVVAVAQRASVPCPACGQRARRVHSRYDHTLADLPWQGVTVHVRLRTRPFLCDAPHCPPRIFTERLPGTAAAYARQTARLVAPLQLLGAALR